METINQQLDGLFGRWEDYLKKLLSDKDKNNKFCRDGLIYKYKKEWGFKQEAPTLSGKDVDKSVNDAWLAAPIKVAFLLKDKPDKSGGDVRQWLLYENPDGECSRELAGGKVGRTQFLPTIARVLYGLHFSSKNHFVSFAEVSGEEMNNVREVWLSTKYPIALVETKKIAGISKVAAEEVKKALERDEEYLREELRILNPNVYVCTHGSIFKFVQDYLKAEYKDPEGKCFIRIPNAQKKNGYEESIVLHEPSKSVILLGYHPSYYFLSPEGRYMSYMDHYRAFVQSEYYPNFFK